MQEPCLAGSQFEGRETLRFVNLLQIQAYFLPSPQPSVSQQFIRVSKHQNCLLRVQPQAFHDDVFQGVTRSSQLPSQSYLSSTPDFEAEASENQRASPATIIQDQARPVPKPSDFLLVTKRNAYPSISRQ